MLTPGVNTCAEILPLEVIQTGDNKLRARPDQMDMLAKYSLLSGWFAGYFTAVNAYDPKSNGDSGGGMKPRDFMHWVFSHCRNNPRDSFIDALNALNKSLGRLPP